MKVVVIFGGMGFIGSFFAEYLILNNDVTKIYLFDNANLNDKKFDYRKSIINKYPQIELVKGDVRKYINWIPKERVDLVANFAAVHREPGHNDYEYFECNIKGAENVCSWASKINCSKIIFTSSIAPYGPSEEKKDESSIPVPQTAYGSSKLVAEKIHSVWQAGDSDRQLVIVRPGVVFGPGEFGNVSQLIKAVHKRYFFYMGNRQTRKAGVYVKELCRAMVWVLESKKAKLDGVTLFNMSMNPGPSIEEYVNAIAKVGKISIWIPYIPSTLLMFIAYLIEVIAKPFGIEHPFSPTRIKKLIRSNNILPTYLVENGYCFKYTLAESLSDWKKDCPEEWR